MGNIKLQQFYPDNGTVKSAEVNANYNAINGSTQTLNEENFGSQSLEREHFDFSGGKLCVLDARIHQNEYELGLGSTPAVGAQYRAATDSTLGSGSDNCTRFSDLEHALTHNSLGVQSTAYNEGLNIAVGGVDGGGNSVGVQIPAGSVLHVFWNVTAWKYTTDTDIAGSSATVRRDYFGRLASGVSADKNGIGNYSFIIYPKFNVAGASPSSSYTNADSFTADTWMNPPDGITADGSAIDTSTSGVNNVKAFADKRNDHWSWVPLIMGTNGNNAGNIKQHALMQDGTLGNNLDDTTIGGPRNICGQTYLKVNQNTTMYGIKLFISGIYGTEYNTSTNKNGVYLENKAHTNSNGGMDGRLDMERGQIGYVIYRPEGV